MKLLRRLLSSVTVNVICLLGLLGVLIYLNISVTIKGPAISLLNDSPLLLAGYSGDAAVDASFAPEGSTKEYLLKAADEENNRDLARMAESIRCTFSKRSHLANGDTVVYACTYDSGLEHKAGIRLKDLEKTYTVASLPEYTEIDPFAGLALHWELGERSLLLKLDAPEELRDIGISWTVYETNTSALITADIDEVMLKSFGYTAKEVTYTMLPLPEKPAQLTRLSESQKNTVREQAVNALLTEIRTCLTDTPIEIAAQDIREIESGFEDSGIYTITFALSADQNYTASYSGRIYTEDDVICYAITTKHGCRYSEDEPHTLLEEH
ncbi:MAG: hypothetical protein IKD69_07555 [Solobacterium sp.]|nr:hypothetical protein [Solobacterium sp.]